MIDAALNGPKVWGPILDAVGSHFEPVVAGGAIRDKYLNIDAKDIDVFVPATFDEDFLTIINKLPAEYAHGSVIYMNPEAITDAHNVPESYRDTLAHHVQKYDMKEWSELTVHPYDEYSGDGFAPDLIGVWEGEILSFPVNIIGRASMANGGSPDLLISTFDFGVLRGWWDSVAQVSENIMLEDIRNHTATLMHNHSYQQSLRRFARFNKRHPGLLALRDKWAK